MQSSEWREMPCNSIINLEIIENEKLYGFKSVKEISRDTAD